jgi:hypothetical protein
MRENAFHSAWGMLELILKIAKKMELVQKLAKLAVTNVFLIIMRDV